MKFTKIPLGILAVVASLFGRTTAVGQTFTQPSTGTTGNWNTASLWSPGIPTSGTTTALTFNVYGNNANSFTFTNDIGAFTANSLTLNNFGLGSLTLALGANALTLDGTNPFLRLNGAGLSTISGAGGVVLNANTTFTGTGVGATTISSIVSGGGGFVVNQTGLGVLNLSGANTFTGGVTLTNGYLGLGNALALGNAANTLTINGGAVRFTAANTIANAITANSNLVVANGSGLVSGTSTGTLTGIISGAGGITLNPYNTSAGLIVQGANTFTGAVTIQSALPNPTLSDATGGTLTVSGTSGVINTASSITIGRGSTLSLAGATGATNGNRIGDSTPITLNGGRLNFTPGAAAINETVGNLTIGGLAHLNTTANGINTWNFGTFTRTGNATMWLNSANFGALTSATTATNVFFSGATPASMGVFAVGSGSGQEIGIIPYMVGSSTTNPRSFVTYDATNGLQIVPYNNSTFVLQQTPGSISAATINNKNVHFNGAGTYTLTGANTINALTTTSSTVTVTGGTLTIASGVIVNFDGLNFSNTTVDFGSNPGQIHNSWNTRFSGTTVVTGTGGLVVTGNSNTRALVFEGSVDNTFSGGITINGNSYYSIFREGHLGAASNNITINGGGLSYNAAANITINRGITLESGGGAFSFNQTTTGATTPTATATTNVNLAGVISGPGAFVKQGTGIVNLTGANTHSGGTMLRAGTLQFTNDGNLGNASGRVILESGTLQPLASVTLPATRGIDVIGSTTLTTASGNTTTVAGPIRNLGTLYGTSSPTWTLNGTGTVALTGASPLLNGTIAVSAGTALSISGNGAIPAVNAITVGAGSTLTIDNGTTYVADRLNDFGNIALGGTGSVASYIAPSSATTDPAERFGILTNASAGSVFSVTGSAAGGTVLRFNSLNATSSLTIRGTGLGAVSLGANTSRIFFEQFTSNVTILTNVFFADTAGTATSTTPAGYDTVRGIVAFTPTPVAGNYIDNIATTATPAPANALPVALTAAFTVDQGYNAGNARAVTGASIYSLTLGGASLDLFGGNAAAGGNGNTPDGTLNLSGGILASSGAPRTIDSDTARTISFGTTAGNITTTTDLTLTANVSLTGSSGFTKAGAGNLNVNGPYVITGPVTVNAGAVNTTGNVTVGDLTVASGATFNPAAGTLTAASLAGTGTISTTAAVAIIGATSGSFGGTMTGFTTLTRSGTGNQTLTSALSYSGATAIQQGTVTVGIAGALPSANAITFGTAAGSSAFNLTLNANQTFSGPFTFVSPTTTTTAITINTGSVLTLATNVDFVNNSTTPDNSFPVVIAGPGFVDLGGGTRNFTVASNNNGGGDLQFTAPIQNGGINYTGNPTPGAIVARMNLGIAGSTYAGDTTVNRGEFRASVMNAFSPNSAVVLAAATGNTATLQLNGLNQTIAGLSSTSAGSNQVTLGTGNLTVNQAINTTTNAVISGSGQLIKTGAGTLTLTGVNTYTGVTTVNGGTLFIGDGTSGSTAAGSAVTANTGATVGGGGTVNGALTIAAGATLAPGNSIGTLTVAGVTTITGAAPDTGAIWSIEASRSAANTIGSNDLLTKTGNLNFANLAAGTPAAGDNKFRLNIVNGPSPLVAGETYSMTIASGAGQILRNGTQVNGSTFTFDANDYQMISPNFTSFTGVALTANTDGSLVLQFTPVPEPATLLGLTALGLAGYGWTRRRKTA